MNRTDYRFTLTRDTDTFEVFPYGFFAGSFKYEQQEGQLFFRRKYSGELTFKGVDFDYLKGRYDLNYYCDIYELLIEKKVNGDYEVDWTGYFSMTDGKFDFERCEFKVSPSTQDKYTNLLDNYDTEFNLLKQNAIFLSSYSSTFYIFIDWNDELESGIPVGLFTNYFADNGGTFSIYFDLIYKQFVDEPIVDSPRWYGLYAAEVKKVKRDVVPSGSGWSKNAEIDEFDIYVRDFSNNNSMPTTGQVLWTADTLPIDEDYTTILDQSPNELGYPGNWLKVSKLNYVTAWVRSDYYSGAKIDTDNTFTYRGRSLNESIRYLLNKTSPDYFINPVLNSGFLQSNTNPVTTSSSFTNNLFLVQKSDAKRPTSSNPATIGNISLSKLLSILYNAFQLLWYLNDDNEFCIVHVSEIGTLTGLDITQSPYISTTANKKSIEFNKSLLYRYEIWRFMEQNGNDFVGNNIEYNELCTIKESNAKTKQYSLENITTDLAYIQSYPEKIDDNGFLLLSTDGTTVKNDIGEITGSNQLNGHLSLANLHENYWRHNRILKTGKMNGVDTIFTTTQKIRKLLEHQIVLCEEFNPNDTVVTELGNAVVNEASFYPLDNKLSLNLSI